MKVQFKQKGSHLRVCITVNPEKVGSDAGAKILDTHVREMCREKGHVIKKLIKDDSIVAEAGKLQGEWTYVVATAPAPEPKPVPKAAPKTKAVPKAEAEYFGKKPASTKNKDLQK